MFLHSFRIAIFFVVLAVSAAAAGADDASSPTLKSSIRLVKFDDKIDEIIVPYDATNGDRPDSGETKLRGMIVSPALNKVVLSRAKMGEAWGMPPREVGVVRLEGRSHDSVFIQLGSGGTGVSNVTLAMLNPESRKVVWIEMEFILQMTEMVTGIQRSPDFDTADMKPESDFLEKIKWEYGYMSQEKADASEADSKFAFYFWKKDNGVVENGPIKVRKYASNLPAGGSVLESLTDETDGGIEYQALFKSGVTARDPRSGKMWVVFHPDSKYCWPTVLKKHKDWLLIGTRGEGLVAVHTKTPWLIRFPLEEKNRDIKTLAIDNGQIIVDDNVKLDLSKLRLETKTE